MKTLLLTFSILFFHIHYVFGSCEGQSCYPSSALPNPGNVTDVEKIYNKIREKYSSDIEALVAATSPLILQATKTKHKVTCRGNLYNDLDLKPELDENYALVEYTVIVSDDKKKNVDMKVRFSFSDKVLAKSEKYQALIKHPSPEVKIVKEQVKNPKTGKEDTWTWYEVQCKNQPNAVATYDTEVQDPVQTKALELPIYGCVVGEREIYALYDFYIGSNDLELDMSKLRANIYSLENDWRLDERFPEKLNYPMECSITPLPGPKDKHMYAKK